MKSPGNCLVGLGLAALLTACASTSLPPPPAAATTTLPDLRGTWSGTWAGAPLTLVVVEQNEFGPSSGIYLGPVQLLGQRAPSLNGVLTSTIRGEAVSINIEGWLGYAGGQITVVIIGRMPSGTQTLTLTRVEAERLIGTGESSFRWGPQGPVDLTRARATTGMTVVSSWDDADEGRSERWRDSRRAAGGCQPRGLGDLAHGAAPLALPGLDALSLGPGCRTHRDGPGTFDHRPPPDGGLHAGRVGAG